MCVNIEEIKTSLQRLEKRVDEQLGGVKDLLLQVIDKVNIALKEKGDPSAPSHDEKDTEVCAPHGEDQNMSTHGVDNAGTVGEGDNSVPVIPEDQNMFTEPIATEAEEDNANDVVGEQQKGLQTDPVMNVVAELKEGTLEE
ncbi:unnamed protein product, partial [Cuscuta epithymum]